MAKTQDNGRKVGETCSSDSSSAIDTERKCQDSMKEKDESYSVEVFTLRLLVKIRLTLNFYWTVYIMELQTV